MGCRGNVFVVTGKDDGKRDGFYIYTHWSGRDIPEIVQEALKKEWRWNDPPYLGRIISETFMSHMNRKETGMGISHCLQDNQIGRDLLIVDIPKKTVCVGNEKKKSWSFGEYIQININENETLSPKQW